MTNEATVETTQESSSSPPTPGTAPTPSVVKFMYLHDDYGGRSMTVAFRRTAEKVCEFSVAISRPTQRWPEGIVRSKGDQFSKKLGRKIATGRLNSPEHVSTATVQDGEKFRGAIVRTMASMEAATKAVPSCAIRMAQDELIHQAMVDMESGGIDAPSPETIAMMKQFIAAYEAVNTSPPPANDTTKSLN